MQPLLIGGTLVGTLPNTSDRTEEDIVLSGWSSSLSQKLLDSMFVKYTLRAHKKLNENIPD